MLGKEQRKRMVSNWKERHPEMGVASVKCKTTGEQFFDTTKDTITWFNRHRFQLNWGESSQQVCAGALESIWGSGF